MLGREVATLVNEQKAPGEYVAVFDAVRLAGGMYIYRLQTATETQTRRMVLVR